jgi:hypothetical protein
MRVTCVNKVSTATTHDIPHIVSKVNIRRYEAISNSPLPAFSWNEKKAFDQRTQHDFNVGGYR